VRKVKKANPAIDIVLMHFVDPSKMKDYRQGKIPEVIKNHTLVAHHYQISTINLAKEVTERIDNEEFTWQYDFKNLHPSPFGQGVYSRSIKTFLHQAFDQGNVQKFSPELNPLPIPIDSFNYENGYLVKIDNASFSRGWTIQDNWIPQDSTGVRQNYHNVPMLTSTQPGSKLSFKFTGKAIGIAVAAGQDAGMIEYRIDKGAWTQQNLFTKWSGRLHLPWYYTLASTLEHKDHLIEIKIAQQKDPRSHGHACRIRYFFVNGKK